MRRSSYPEKHHKYSMMQTRKWRKKAENGALMIKTVSYVCEQCQLALTLWGDYLYRDAHTASLSFCDTLSGRQEIIPPLISKYTEIITDKRQVCLHVYSSLGVNAGATFQSFCSLSRCTTPKCSFKACFSSSQTNNYFFNSFNHCFLMLSLCSSHCKLSARIAQPD